MTATITIFSLVPLLFAQGPGSEVQRPLAVVVVGGLVTSTLMTLARAPGALQPFRRGQAKLSYDTLGPDRRDSRAPKMERPL